MIHSPDDLFAGPQPTLLPEDLPAARQSVDTAGDPFAVAARAPASSLAWAVLAEQRLREAGGDDAVTAYAFARTGYHRGLDALRKAGWRGQGPIPVEHVPNQGFLRALLALAEAAERIGEHDEAERCRRFLREAGTSPEEVAALR